MSNDHLIIFDTTLRDGEQSPGASMTREEKVRIARQLERMQVDVIEAGFPAASNGDFESVKAVAKAIKTARYAVWRVRLNATYSVPERLWKGRVHPVFILLSLPVRFTWKRNCGCRLNK